MSEDSIFQYEEIRDGRETRVITPKDLTPNTIKRIAAVALQGPDENTDVGHAFKRRYGTAEMLTFLATMPTSTHVEFIESKVGLFFPDPTKEPHKARAVRVRDQEGEQRFLRKHADEMAFVTDRVLGKVSVQEMKVLLPSWVVGVNQVTSARPSERDKEIETVISEQGWLVGLMAMAASGLEEKDVIKKFQQFEREFGIKMPKRGWFADPDGVNQLASIINAVPKYEGFRLDFETLDAIERRIDFINKILPEDKLPFRNPDDLYDPTPIVIKKGEIVYVLPSEHEYNIREAVQTGKNKADIHRDPRVSDTGRKYIDRFLTVYPSIQNVEFYPYEGPFKVYDKEAGHESEK